MVEDFVTLYQFNEFARQWTIKQRELEEELYLLKKKLAILETHQSIDREYDCSKK